MDRELERLTPSVGRAVIRADKDARHARVIAVLDVPKRAKISKIGFAVTPAEAN